MRRDSGTILPSLEAGDPWFSRDFPSLRSAQQAFVHRCVTGAAHGSQRKILLGHAPATFTRGPVAQEIQPLVHRALVSGRRHVLDNHADLSTAHEIVAVADAGVDDN